MTMNARAIQYGFKFRFGFLIVSVVSKVFRPFLF